MDGTEYQRCGDMLDVNQYWDNTGRIFTKLKYLFISVGCNDLKTQSPHELFTSISRFVQRVWNKYPDLKIIISEVTPRMDLASADVKVKEANILLNQFSQSFPNLYLTNNSNLRKPANYFPDGIHLQHHIIPLFASNIKRALRKAYGIKFDRNKFKTKRETPALQNNSGYDDRNFQPTQWEDVRLQMLRNELFTRLKRPYQYSGT